MINRPMRLQKQHMAKYEPMMREARRNMTTLPQRYMLRNMVALAFGAGYRAGYADGLQQVKDEQWKPSKRKPILRPVKPNGDTSAPRQE